MSKESPFEKLKSIEDPITIATSYIEEAADAYRDDEQSNLAISIYELPRQGNVLRFQPLKVSRDNKRQVLGPAEEIVKEITNYAIDALMEDHGEYTWETALHFDREVSGGFLIYVDLDRLEKSEE